MYANKKEKGGGGTVDSFIFRIRSFKSCNSRDACQRQLHHHKFYDVVIVYGEAFSKLEALFSE